MIHDRGENTPRNAPRLTWDSPQKNENCSKTTDARILIIISLTMILKVALSIIIPALAFGARSALGNVVGNHLERVQPENVANDKKDSHDMLVDFSVGQSPSHQLYDVGDESNTKESLIPVMSHRMTSECGNNNGQFKIDLTTDYFGHETSWRLQVLKDDAWIAVVSGPPNNSNFLGNTRYVGVQCLLPGKYKFTIFDKAKDGMCCSKGDGKYSAYIDGSMRFSSPPASTTWAKRVHLFTISPPLALRPNNESQCDPSTDRKIKVVIKTDKYGEESSWYVRDSQTGEVVARNMRKYGANTTDTAEICLKDGRVYNFFALDENGDGMCCTHGDGYFKVHLEDNGSWKEIISGGNFKAKEYIQTIDLSSKAHDMSDRDREWLDSHNNKRRVWHARYNKTFSPLSWDSSLESESKVWATHLLSSCGKNMWHDPNNTYGENIASNSGTGSWALRRTTDDIVARFVDREENKLYPENLHLTQVLWRSTKYVGCAEASKTIETGGVCHTQVCRYARPGNCNMNKYMSTAKDWWVLPMMMDNSPCGPLCPSNGCH